MQSLLLLAVHAAVRIPPFNVTLSPGSTYVTDDKITPNDALTVVLSVQEQVVCDEPLKTKSPSHEKLDEYKLRPLVAESNDMVIYPPLLLNIQVFSFGAGGSSVDRSTATLTDAGDEYWEELLPLSTRLMLKVPLTYLDPVR